MANSDTKLVNELYTLAHVLGGEFEDGKKWDWETVHEAALRLAGHDYVNAQIEERCDRACGEDADLDVTEALMQIWEFVRPGVNDPDTIWATALEKIPMSKWTPEEMERYNRITGQDDGPVGTPE